MKPIYFELGSLLGAILTAILIATLWKNQKDYWIAFCLIPLHFWAEWLADWEWMFLRYDFGFHMLFGRLPMMIIPAFIAFFVLPLIICLRFESKLGAMPLWRQIATLFIIFCVWDFVVEYGNIRSGLWIYHQPKEWMINGIFPWIIPPITASGNILLYYGHKIARKYSIGKSLGLMLWMYFLAYFNAFALLQVPSWILVNFIFGIQPLPTF